MEKKNSYQVFMEEAPEAAAAFNGLIGSLQNKGLDPKTMQLIYIGIKASQGGADAVAAHVPMAKEAGATWDEIKSAILLTLTVSGVSGVLACLAPAMDAYRGGGVLDALHRKSTPPISKRHPASQIDALQEGVIKMDNEQIPIIDLIIEAHIGLQRQGPGSREMTARALSFLDIADISRAADLGCGTGGQTMILAESIRGSVVGLDQIPDFIAALNARALKQGLQDRVSGIAGSMENLPFQKEWFDLIWSEGAIDAIGFEKRLTHWNSFLKMNGYVSVSCPCWFTDEHPAEVGKFWADAGSGLNTIEHNISAMQRAGYAPIAVFTLPEQCFTDNYFDPRAEAEKVLLARHAGNKTAEAYVANDKYEVELYSKYKQLYGYAFYIGKKYRTLSDSSDTR